ncbi:MAG: hypothetical protein WCH43_09950, partial [Verrucomicrobiota bacterium]
LSRLLGVLLVSVALACGGIFLRGLALQMLVASGSVFSGYLGIRRLCLNPDKIAWPKPANKMEVALCALIILQFAIVVWIQSWTALGWDGLLDWEIKARYAFLNGGGIPLGYFSDPTRAFSHPDYPLMLPMLEAWIYLWMGDCHQFWVRFIFPVFYFAGALVAYSGVTRLSGKKWAGLMAAGMLFFLPFPVAGSWNIFAGYADLPLAVFYLAGLIGFLRYQVEPSSRQLALVSLLAGLMPWIKREGIVLWCCLMAVVMVELLRRRKMLAAVLVILPGLIVCLGWKIVVTVLAACPSTDFLPFSIELVGRNLPRLVTGLQMLAGELLKTGSWSLLWIGFPVALLCLVCDGRRKIAAQLLFCVAMPLLLLTGAFILSNWAVFQSHIRTSLPRLVLQVAPVAVFAIGLAVGGNQTRIQQSGSAISESAKPGAIPR